MPTLLPGRFYRYDAPSDARTEVFVVEHSHDGIRLIEAFQSDPSVLILGDAELSSVRTLLDGAVWRPHGPRDPRMEDFEPEDARAFRDRLRGEFPKNWVRHDARLRLELRIETLEGLADAARFHIAESNRALAGAEAALRSLRAERAERTLAVA